MYVILSFDNHEDFLTYKRTVEGTGKELEAKDVTISLISGRSKVAVIIEVNLPIPDGPLHVKTYAGKEMVIEVSSFSRKVYVNSSQV